MVSSTNIVLSALIAVLIRFCNGQNLPSYVQGVRGLTEGQGFNKPVRCGNGGLNCLTVDKDDLTDDSNACTLTDTCTVGAYAHFGKIDGDNRTFYVLTIRASNTTFVGPTANNPYFGTFFTELQVGVISSTEIYTLLFDCGHEAATIRYRQTRGTTRYIGLEMIEVNTKAPTPLLTCAYYLYPLPITATSDPLLVFSPSDKMNFKLTWSHHGNNNPDGQKETNETKPLTFLDIDDKPRTTRRPGPVTQPDPLPSGTPEQSDETVVTPKDISSSAVKADSSKNTIIIVVVVILVVAAIAGIAFFVLSKKPKQKVDMVLGGPVIGPASGIKEASIQRSAISGIDDVPRSAISSIN